MTTNPDQTVAPAKREQGRPPKSEVLPAVPAEFFGGRIPPIRCPHCGRYDEPRKDGNGKILASGEVYCTCKLCGKRFAWLVPTVRKILPK